MVKKNATNNRRRNQSAPRQQTRKARPRPRPQRSLSVRPNVHLAAMETCSIINPFCPEARSAKWPDGSLTKTSTWTYEGRWVLYTPAPAGTGATSSSSSLFLANWNSFGAYNTNYDATDVATYANNNINAGVHPTGVARWRLVSWGLEVKNVGAALSAAGVIRVRLMSPLTGSSLTNVATTTYQCDETYDFPISDRRSFFILPKKIGTEANLFRDTTTYASTTVSNWQNPGWQVVNICINGAPANTTSTEVRYVYNYEIVFDEGDSKNYYTTASPPTNLTQQQSTSTVSRAVGSFVEGSASFLDKIVKSKATKYFAGLLTGLATKNPKAGYQAYLATDTGQQLLLEDGRP